MPLAVLPSLDPVGHRLDGTAGARLARMAGTALQMAVAVVFPPGGDEPSIWLRRGSLSARPAEHDCLVAAGCAAETLAMLGVPLLLADAARTPVDWAQMIHRAAGWRAVAAVAIPSGRDGGAGTLVVADVAARAWTDDDVVLLRDLAMVAAAD